MAKSSGLPFGGQIKVGPLTESDQAAVLALAEAATWHDGVAPLSEVPLLQLSSDSPLITHVIVLPQAEKNSDSGGNNDGADDGEGGGADDGEGDCEDSVGNAALGYAQIDRSGEFASAELVVHPGVRRGGIGRKLLKIAENDARMPAVSGAGLTSGKELRVWAHGDLPAAQGFATTVGFAPVRELLLLSRPLQNREGQPNSVGHPPPPRLPEGYQFREFTPGRDDAAWVAVNALAFADHPEQGRLTVADLQTRQREPWFNPQHFHLITVASGEYPDGEIAAYCWAKVADDQSGEIYAIGVHPRHRRRRLAAYLLQAAFDQMAAAGLSRTTLYVEGDNEAALAAYYTAGFTPVTADIQYAKTPLA